MNDRNAFLPLQPKNLEAALNQMAAEFERPRAIKRRQLRRSIAAAFVAATIFAALANVGTWPGRAAIALAVVALIAGVRAVRRLRRA